MATERRRVLVEQEVELCDRCKTHKGPMETRDLYDPGGTTGGEVWSGIFCPKCCAIMDKMNLPRERKRKTALGAIINLQAGILAAEVGTQVPDQLIGAWERVEPSFQPPYR